MKETRSLVSSLLAGGIALAMVSTLTAQTAKEEFAKIIKIQGPARYQDAGGAWQPLKVGDVLKAGSIVQTAVEPGSFVDVVLTGAGALPSLSVQRQPTTVQASAGYHAKGEQDVVRVFENSALAVEKLTCTDTGAAVVTDTELDLKKGHILGNVKKTAAGSRYEIKYPNGVAGIRGTIYDMRLIESIVDGKVTVKCILSIQNGSGVLSYYDSTGKLITQNVSSGQSIDTGTGQITVIPPEVLNQITSVLPTLNPPTGIASYPRTPDQTIIQEVTSTKGTQ